MPRSWFQGGCLHAGLNKDFIFLASDYNCGAGKTRGAMDRHGEYWYANVPTETQIYLKKFDAVWEWMNVHPQTVRTITIRGSGTL